eukprot:930598-Heterocapsa_arctica.AAC.1
MRLSQPRTRYAPAVPGHQRSRELDVRLTSAWRALGVRLASALTVNVCAPLYGCLDEIPLMPLSCQAGR